MIQSQHSVDASLARESFLVYVLLLVMHSLSTYLLRILTKLQFTIRCRPFQTEQRDPTSGTYWMQSRWTDWVVFHADNKTDAGPLGIMDIFYVLSTGTSSCEPTAPNTLMSTTHILPQHGRPKNMTIAVFTYCKQVPESNLGAGKTRCLARDESRSK